MVLTWDVDFGGDLELMASIRLDAVVINTPARLIQRKQQFSLAVVTDGYSSALPAGEIGVPRDLLQMKGPT